MTYEVKIKNGTGAMTTAKMKLLLSYNLKIVIQCSMNLWWGESNGENFGQ